MRYINLALEIGFFYADSLQILLSVIKFGVVVAWWGQQSSGYMRRVGLLAKSRGNAPKDATHTLVPKESHIRRSLLL